MKNNNKTKNFLKAGKVTKSLSILLAVCLLITTASALVGASEESEENIKTIIEEEINKDN